MPDRFLAPETLSKELGIPPSTLAKWRQYGGSPRYAKFGKNVRYERCDADRWIESMKRRTTLGYESPIAFEAKTRVA